MREKEVSVSKLNHILLELEKMKIPLEYAQSRIELARKALNESAEKRGQLSRNIILFLEKKGEE
jgi:hypothetical protein